MSLPNILLDRLYAIFLNCDPGGIRTHDPQLRRLLLYPTELRDHRHFVRLGRKMLRKGNQKLIIHNPFVENSPRRASKIVSFVDISIKLRQVVNRYVAFMSRELLCFFFRFGHLGRNYYLSHDFANGLCALD